MGELFSVCEYYVHVDCSDLAVSDCKEAATYVANMESVSQLGVKKN